MKSFLQITILAVSASLMLSCVPVKKYNQLNKSISYKSKDLDKLKKELLKLQSDSLMLKDSLNSIVNQY